MRRCTQHVTQRLLLAILMGFVGLSLHAANNPKEALLIANANYVHFPGLPSTLSDAELLKSKLEGIGFRVTLKQDASREQILEALQGFEERLKATHGIAFFHYGGHAVQVNGHNYLIPTDAEIPDEKRVSYRAVDLQEVLTSLEVSGAAVNIAILDACRDNPLPKTSERSVSRGLAVLESKPKNSLVVFSASEGSTARDGLFTPVLASYIAQPGLSLTQVMMKVRKEIQERTQGDQRPGEYNELVDDVYLAGGEGSTLPPIKEGNLSDSVNTQPFQSIAYQPTTPRLRMEDRPNVALERVPDDEFPIPAQIQDPDGFTNIRVGRSTNSSIIGTVREGELFYVHPDASSWWKVKTRNQISGFIHKSRIVMKKIYVSGLDPNGDNWLALKSAPDLRASRLRKLAPDTPLTPLEFRGIWVRVLLDDGMEGWVYSKYVNTH
jgi:SH3-like domain-containing protein